MKNVDLEKVLAVVGSILKVAGHILVKGIVGLSKFMIHLTWTATKAMLP